MSLLSTIQLASNSLAAAQVGLQVHGNNIANANTPGYIRQEVVRQAAPVQQRGNLTLGLGVQINGIVQNLDRFLAERLRGAIGDLANSDVQGQTYLELESLLGELGETDLSTSLTDFFGAINDVLNQPDDLSVRNNAVLQADTLVSKTRRLHAQATELRANVNGEIVDSAGQINGLLQDISQLNVKIVQIESSSDGQAVGLRDQRELALQELAGVIGIRTVEQESGAVSVFSGGEFLVIDNTYQEVGIRETLDGGSTSAQIVVEATDAPLAATSGRLAGRYAARDEILAGFLEQLEDFTAALAGEFNRVFSQGQGLTGFTDLTGAHRAGNETDPLDQVELPYTPLNGSFQIQVRNTKTGIVETTDVLVDLDGLDEDTSLQDLAETLDAIDGIQAEVTPTLELRLRADSADSEFAFANDSSGVLAALGLNVFFTGSKPTDLGISTVLQLDPAKFAASAGGIAADAENVQRLANFSEQGLDTFQGQSVLELYEQLVMQTTQGSAVRQSVSEGLRSFEGTLQSQHLATSGVSIDDEAIGLITQQRMYQASARIVSTIADLLDTLINL